MIPERKASAIPMTASFSACCNLRRREKKQQKKLVFPAKPCLTEPTLFGWAGAPGCVSAHCTRLVGSVFENA
jgi:hypothetical protein